MCLNYMTKVIYNIYIYIYLYIELEDDDMRNLSKAMIHNKYITNMNLCRISTYII